jgi:predicted lipoprotein with Yx(FWY)xxD motif
MAMHLLASSLALVVVLGACGGAAAPSPTPVPTPTPSPTPSPTAVVKIGDTALGKILVDSTKSMTLYTWAKDTDENSQCYDACATAWPPLITTVTTIAGTGVKGSLGTSKRKDGALQVTINKHPLYFFSRDTAAGDTKGQGSQGFGALWTVVIDP